LFEKNKKEGQICGFIIAFDFSKDIINAVSKLRDKEDVIIALKYIRDIVPYENPPKVTLTANELEDLECKIAVQAVDKKGLSGADKVKIDVKRKNDI